jgi:hypothetical protein
MKLEMTSYAGIQDTSERLVHSDRLIQISQLPPEIHYNKEHVTSYNLIVSQPSLHRALRERRYGVIAGWSFNRANPSLPRA